MAITTHVYQIFVHATPEEVWTAITDSAWTRRYFHSTSFVTPLVQGEPYRTVLANGSPAVEGVVSELTPPADGRPGRLVLTWGVRYDEVLAAEPPGVVEWSVEVAGEGLTRVRLVHGDLAFSPLTWAHVKDGWVWVLDSMKTLLETGTELPQLSATVTDGPADSPDWHRAQGVEAHQATWSLIERADRTDTDDEDMLRCAYASAYHWQRAARRGPENESRACYLLAKVLLLTGQATAALRSADRSLDCCQGHHLVDFDLAYAYEARARALTALGRQTEAAEAWDLARSVPIADAEDREIVERDFADLVDVGHGA